MALGATISDLHLFSHHSRPERYFAQIDETVRGARLFVLNGDIFDFKWSEHGGFSRSVEVAEHFLEELVRQHPRCRFQVVLGNHDAVPPYIEVLQKLEERHANLFWHEFACIAENRVFLHGDVINAGSSNSALRRFRSRLQVPANGHPLQRMAHSAIHRSHVPWAAYKVLPNRILAARILAYLNNEHWLNGTPIRHVHFGHTHCAFEDFQFRGYYFHNSGSATHGSRLRVVKFPLQEEE